MTLLAEVARLVLDVLWVGAISGMLVFHLDAHMARRHRVLVGADWFSAE